MISRPNMLGMLADLVKSGTLIIRNPGVPVDGAAGTGVNLCGTGSMYIDTTNANVYINGGTKAAPIWKLITRAA